MRAAQSGRKVGFMKTKTEKLANTAMLVALHIALSYAVLWEQPMGGAVTAASMLPLMLISIVYGAGWGTAGAAVASLFQLLQAVIKGNVFVWCETADIIVLCALFDYVVPYTILGLSGLLRNRPFGKFRHFGIYLGMVLAVLLRFVCHYVTGVAIWGQWAPEGMGAHLYSLLYNGGFLLPDLAIALVAAVALLERRSVQKLLKLPVDTAVLEKN